MSSQSTFHPANMADSVHPIAFSMQLSRNMVVQAFGLGMVSVMGLSVAPWPIVMVWALTTFAVVTGENRLLRLMAAGDLAGEKTAALAKGVRIMVTTLYASAALTLITRGGPGENLFAFALISASMVHVLMRYYRSPRILLISLTPYTLVLGFAGLSTARTALQQGHMLEALAPAFTITMFAIQFWSARAQLSSGWVELMAAREAAETRERAADAANRAKSQFLANMSHELRTPLNGVLGMAQALRHDGLTRTQRERVSVIQRSSENLLSVLNDLLDLSKVEASALELEVAEFDMEHLIRGVATAYRPLAANKALTFEFEITNTGNGRYLGDAARLRRILYSLADNAVKFTHDGGVSLRVDREAEQVIFRISDTGIGINQADLDRLFEGFFQADATLSRRYGGAGIGLAVCGQLTTLMGGVIEATSQPGVGSTFTLKIPMLRAKATEPACLAEPVAAEGSASLQVLMAEDNATNQMVLKTLLGLAGISPTVVENGLEAVSAWERQDWDVVLMDIQMPEMNGVEATRAIRQGELKTGRTRTPIIAVTANAMTHQVAEYEAAGMDGVVAKPIDMANLLSEMERALDGAPTPERAQA